MERSEDVPLQDDLQIVRSSLNAVLDRLVATTQDVANDPLFKVAQPADYDLLHGLATPGSASPVDQVIQEMFTICDYRARMNHPRLMAFVPSPTSPYSWLGDALSSAFNSFAGSRLQGSGPGMVEKKLVEWLASTVGLPSTAGGVFVSGGSMANLTAMVLARDQILPSGQQSRGVAYLSDLTHYSVSKAFRILGFSPHQVRRLPTDKNLQFQPKLLAETIRADKEAGLIPFVVVATCGTTNTGTIDPLLELSEVCKKEGLWLHADGAYGASAALSASHSHLTKELCHVDSLSWDAHKWLFQTYSCGIVLVRDKKHLNESFASEGDYLRDASEDEHVPNFWSCGIELTRPARAMKLWFTLRVLGVETIGKMIDNGFALAEKAQEELLKLPDWEITSPACLAILTFRFAPQGKTADECDELNANISKRLVAENIAGILTTKLNGRVVLRICAISPSLDMEGMSTIVKQADKVARTM